MLPEHMQNIEAGLFHFLITGIALVVPVVVFHYFRYGRVEPRRSFVLYATLLYGLVLLALVFMPFPSLSSVCDGRQTTQWVPFHFIAELPETFPLLSFAFNVALFLPLGVLLRKAYGLQLRWVLLAGFLASLVVEIIQVTGNLGIYPCPYRLFDVDDLMANTLGATLGGLIAPAAVIVPKVLPAKEVLAQLDAVGLPTQVLAYGLDVVLLGIVVSFVGVTEWAFLIVFALIRVVTPLLADGYTPAGRLLKFRVRQVDGTPATCLRLVVREVFGPLGLLALLALGFFTLMLVGRTVGSDTLTEVFGPVQQMQPMLVAVLIAGAAFTLFLLAPVARRDQRGWHDRIAGVRCVPDRANYANLVRTK
ncbi:VanZ family protein [Allokutzneria sp. A3M-2-11 16]|uniref:VanZ family protein n=1 Tax=Allokutzneria sp. A3M-2-11 16 TaxID=2962043 RepID=UPI0020B7E77A|nr:VanZ family protein [Allokutzneria sp. A3M-2-11 16]MCP3800004.1 VanZ family protein [Allokutzneria sp. A3M-2-11 16]